MNKQNGFTLLELMITCAIIAILASLAIPSYRRQIEKTQCEDGKALLSSSAQQMEQRRSENAGKYDAKTIINNSTTFTVKASNVTATTYTLTATATPAAHISGTMTLTAANEHGGTLAGACNW